jgi:twitching motility protein PilI
MANKQALRELQTRLAERLQAAGSEERAASWLAVESGGCGFLLPLAQAGEIFAMAPLVEVPHTREWFAGVANLRGQLFGVVDLARFLGLSSQPGDEARLVVFNPNLELNCALQVERLAGLRNAAQLEAEAAPEGERPAFVGARYSDAAGRRWQELNLAALAADDAFMKIVAD